MSTANTVTEQGSEKTVVAGGIRLHYHDIGSGDPIIALHGGGPGATAWSNFQGNIEALSANNRLILFDMPGWGRSEFPDSAVPKEFISWMGEVLESFMDALGIESSDYIGNSMGGQAVLGLALRNPDRIKRMVLIGSQPTETLVFQPLPQFGIQTIIDFYSGDGPTPDKMRAMVTSMVHDPKLITDELVNERFGYATSPEALDQARRKSKQHRQDQYFELHKNKVKTLLVWGQEDRGGALEAGLMMLRRFQDARMYMFAKCGHWAQVEHRDEFNRVVLEFFAA